MGDENWTLHEDVLLFKDQVFVPDEGDLRARLLDKIHCQPSTAHPGKNKIKQLVQARYYWITWNKDVERYVDNLDHAQTDGQTEIANQYLSQRLRLYVNHFQDDWSEWLPIINFAAASLPQDSTGLSPFMIEKGFQPRMSFDWRKPDLPRKFTANEKNARVWVKRFQEIWDFARGNLEIA
ncbi:gag/polymerase/env polyprotein, putative [Talaromyces stipitatus ATCC 10500]|uniref:Gag/polymerase/env polyprotein, putative n=1 Tax=Talaromyces stipitatus (strain ATCC 10500 / CBS 375.48 / QM 6759 / NRRL 1006) TaxID=441959 RepID=B8MLZ6_TALSN|nr:gag/polymerase/env polyprotein, putative [Talaromyces stipitatus ATCC 10500]EED13508.1 gag/polymerase/env polyprotein, putative [Talaromyces stipitatus ATCC 10500]